MSNDKQNKTYRAEELTGAAKDKANEAQQKREAEEGPTIQMFFTKDGTPVEPSTIPSKTDTAKTEPDLSARPDVHSARVPADKSDVRNENDLRSDSNR